MEGEKFLEAIGKVGKKEAWKLGTKRKTFWIKEKYV